MKVRTFLVLPVPSNLPQLIGDFPVKLVYPVDVAMDDYTVRCTPVLDSHQDPVGFDGKDFTFPVRLSYVFFDGYRQFFILSKDGNRLLFYGGVETDSKPFLKRINARD